MKRFEGEVKGQQEWGLGRMTDGGVEQAKVTEASNREGGMGKEKERQINHSDLTKTKETS